MKLSFRLLLSLCYWCVVCGVVIAQTQQVFRDDIRTLRVEQNGVLTALPLLTLGSDEQVRISFDQLSHDHHRFFYRVELCNFDWTPNREVFVTEALERQQADIPIEEHTESRNTTVHYTHYAFDFPNAEVRPLLSGNYRLHIFDEASSDDKPIATICCAMVEPLVKISAHLTTDTDVDVNGSHQQLDLSIDVAALPAYDLRNTLKTVVYQNESLVRSVVNPPFSYQGGSILTWKHQPQLIFEAGNEYRSFEQLTLRSPGMRVERIEWFAPYHHATLLTDLPARNYLQREDRNGTAVVRNTDNWDNDTESDYLFVHFFVSSPLLPQTEVCIDGKWADALPLDERRMHYDATMGGYRGTLLLKQGYYNYRYLARTADSDAWSAAPFEGNFYPTENEYSVRVYHRSLTDRHDRLVGHQRF